MHYSSPNQDSNGSPRVPDSLVDHRSILPPTKRILTINLPLKIIEEFSGDVAFRRRCMACRSLPLVCHLPTPMVVLHCLSFLACQAGLHFRYSWRMCILLLDCFAPRESTFCPRHFRTVPTLQQPSSARDLCSCFWADESSFCLSRDS